MKTGNESSKDTVIKLVCVNNNTDKEYVYESINKFGLYYYHSLGVIVIVQYISEDKINDLNGGKLRLLAKLVGFSIKEIFYKP